MSRSERLLALLQLLHDARVQGRALLDDGREPRDLLALPERQMRALRGQRLCVFTPEESDVLIRPGPRMAEAARIMARCIADKAS